MWDKVFRVVGRDVDYARGRGVGGGRFLGVLVVLVVLGFVGGGWWRGGGGGGSGGLVDGSCVAQIKAHLFIYDRVRDSTQSSVTWFCFLVLMRLYGFFI